MSPSEFLLGLAVCFQFTLGTGEKFDYGLFEDPGNFAQITFIYEIVPLIMMFSC